jgi:hypothetical protein
MISRPFLPFLPFLALPIFALVASVAQAAETGGIRGRVVDGAGAPVSGARLVLSGPALGGELTSTSDADGWFRIISVPVGTHELRVLREGFVPTRMSVSVRLDETTYVPARLTQKGTASEEIVVEEEMPVVDATASSFKSEMSSDLLENLPVGRSYQTAVNLLPGVSGRVDTSEGGPADGNPSVRGEGQYGNNFLVDGISTRDPATKTFSVNVNFDAIEDIQVFTDGAPAEYGQFLGMMVNVVTKDGGDEHHGSAGYWIDFDASPGTYLIADLDLGREVSTPKRDFLVHSLSATAGGPIVKERLWYFLAFDGGLSHYVYEGTDPDYPQLGRDGSLMAKLTWFATPDITAQYTFNGELGSTDNFETSSQVLPEAQSYRTDSEMTHLARLKWRPSNATLLEAKGGTTRSTIDVVPASGDTDAPSIFDRATGLYSSNYGTTDLNGRTRTGGGLTLTQLFSHIAGDHKWKLGAEYWVLRDSRDLKATGAGEGTGYVADSDAGLPCTAASDYADCYEYYEYMYGGDVHHKGDLLSGFIQDDWQPIKRLTFNVGIRADNEQLYNTDDESIVDEWMPAPRLGVAWDVTGDSRTLVSLNAGRYYDINGNDFVDWADSRTSQGYTLYVYDQTKGGYVFAAQQDPVAYPTTYDEDLRAAHMDKITLGVEREIIPALAIGLRGIASRTTDIPEDLNIDDYTWLITNSEYKYRTYRALELTVDKKYDEVWQLLASYTLSESKGMTPGQFETASGGSWGSDGNNVGVYLDDINDAATRQALFDAGYGWYLQMFSGLGREGADAGWYGYLPYHTLHSVKLNGSYTAPWGTTFGAVYEFDSGRAWQKRTWIDYDGDYLGFAEGRGSRFMPPVNYLDLRAAHKLKLKGKRSLEVSVDVFNVLDLETPITYYENDDANFGLTLYRQAPRAIRGGIKYVY